MKRILLVFLIGVALLLAVGGLFYTHVGIRHVLSHNASDWASFGEYFGGVAGTLLAFISILLLVYTVYIQNEQLSNAQHQMLKRDLLAHVTKADDEIGHWLGRQIALPSLSGATVESGDVVWGLLEPKQVDPKEFQRAVVRLHVLTCLYCEALALVPRQHRPVLHLQVSQTKSRITAQVPYNPSGASRPNGRPVLEVLSDGPGRPA